LPRPSPTRSRRARASACAICHSIRWALHEFASEQRRWCAADQSRHARCAGAGRRTPIPRRISFRSARDRDSRPCVEANLVRSHPPHASGQIGGGL
jgi:hypothetical protein